MKISKIILAIFALSAQFAFAENYMLENEKIRFEIDGSGRLVSLKNFETNREYTKGGSGLWRVIFTEGAMLEEVVESTDVPFSAEKKDGALVLNYGGEFPVKIECRLVGDDVRFRPTIENASKNKILREFQFPLVNNLNLTAESDLLMSCGGGERCGSVRAYALKGFTKYKWHDNLEVQTHVLYPGKAAMNCMVVDEPGAALYIAQYDPNFGKALHFARLPNISKRGGREYGLPTLGMAKYPFLKAGAKKVLPEYVVSPQTGDWHKSMKKYRAWAESSWYKPAPKTKDFLESNGWQRVIMRHQCGKVLFGYDKIKDMYTAAEEAGMHTLRLYSWWKEGMDSGNPNYTEDDTQGGDAELAKQIKAVQARGGKVNLYFNGQIIDTSTEFYKTVGKDLCIKRVGGFPDTECYIFGGGGTSMRVFPHITFAIACPSSKLWLEKMKSFADRAIALGADGIYYDQMGHDIYPCCDPNHGHPVPFMEINKCKHDMFKKVCEYIRAKKPGMTIGVELVCDHISPLADYVHNGVIACKTVRYDRGGKPLTSHVQMYQYAFPEFATCDLGLYDDDDCVRSVNLSLMRSWRSDVSIYRGHDTIDATPNYKAYLKKANAIRDRFRDLILNGKFRDTDLAKCSNPKIEYSTFENGDRIAVVTTQSHLKRAEAVFSADGYEYAEHGGLGDFSAKPAEGGAAKVEMKKNALVVIVFKKK